MSIDTTLLDKAIIFAVHAHAGTERRGKGFPYAVHPLEVVSIVATMTADQELLAAAALHDVVEDTDYTVADIEREFGPKVARLVEAESDSLTEAPDANKTDSWHARKQATMDRLKGESLEAKTVALGDKLSNMRAIARDYAAIGDQLWQRFHTTDPAEHAWHYRGLADALSELADTEAYQEFVSLMDKVFPAAPAPFSLTRTGNVLEVAGRLGRDEAKAIAAELSETQELILDFNGVTSVNFAAQRVLLNCRNDGLLFNISNASSDVCATFDHTGVARFVSVREKPSQFDMTTVRPSGDGYTAESFFSNDEDSMMKLYYDFIPQSSLEREKRCALASMSAGVPTPLSGGLIKVGNRNGMVFERIMDKESVARALADHPENLEEYARRFAALCKALHSKPCDKTVFPSTAALYRNLVLGDKVYDRAQKQVMLDFLDTVPETGCCLHGDLHVGNVIIADGHYLFIDMADFGYGNANFDLGTLYYSAFCTPPDLTMKLYHVTVETMREFWARFVSYYFEAAEPAKVEAVGKGMLPFAALKALHFMNIAGASEHLSNIVSKAFFER